MAGVTYTNTNQRAVRRVPRDLLQARELLFDLVWKDLRVRYRYAAMGFLWAILEPLALMVVLTFVFSFVLKAKLSFVDDATAPPFAVFLLCGLIFWQFFAASVAAATQSLLDNQNLVQKVHFPREVVPLAAAGYPLFNLFIGFLILLGVHVLYGGSLHPALLWIPLVFVLQFALTIGLALLLSCGNVLYRDVGYMVNVAILFGFYATPVFYPLRLVTEAEAIPGWLQQLYLANPMAGLLTAYRQVLFEARFPDAGLLFWPAVLAAAALILGVVAFRRAAPTISDHL